MQQKTTMRFFTKPSGQKVVETITWRSCNEDDPRKTQLPGEMGYWIPMGVSSPAFVPHTPLYTYRTEWQLNEETGIMEETEVMDAVIVGSLVELDYYDEVNWPIQPGWTEISMEDYNSM